MHTYAPQTECERELNRNLTEVVTRVKSIIIGDFSAQVGNGRTGYGEAMAHFCEGNKNKKTGNV
jgi:hypothetical protein